MPSSGFSVAYVSLAAVVSVSAFALCAVTALNSWPVQNEACISAAECEHLPFLGSRVEIIFR